MHRAHLSDLHLFLQETVSVNISKCEFTIESAGGASPAGANGGQTSSLQDNEDASEDEEEEGEVAELDSFLEVGAPADGLNSLTAAISADPSMLLQPSETLATFARAAAKELIDYAAKQVAAGAPIKGTSGSGGGALHQTQTQAQIYVDGFDPEQIWLQLDMVSVPAIKRARRLLRKAGDISRLVPEDVEEALDGETLSLFF